MTWHRQIKKLRRGKICVANFIPPFDLKQKSCTSRVQCRLNLVNWDWNLKKTCVRQCTRQAANQISNFDHSDIFIVRHFAWRKILQKLNACSNFWSYPFLLFTVVFSVNLVCKKELNLILKVSGTSSQGAVGLS